MLTLLNFHVPIIFKTSLQIKGGQVTALCQHCFIIYIHICNYLTISVLNIFFKLFFTTDIGLSHPVFNFGHEILIT